MVGMCGVNRYLSDPDMVAAQLVEQEYLQALGKLDGNSFQGRKNTCKAAILSINYFAILQKFTAK